MKRGTIFLLKVAVFVIGIIMFAFCISWLPVLAREAAVLNLELAYLRYPVLIGVYCTGTPFLYALYQTYRLLTFIEHDRAFSDLAVRSLDQIKNCAMLIFVLYVIGICLLATLHALHPGILIIAIVIIFAALVILVFAAVLKELLRNALELKSENEMTV